MCPTSAKPEAKEHGSETREPNATQKLPLKGQFKESAQIQKVPFISTQNKDAAFPISVMIWGQVVRTDSGLVNASGWPCRKNGGNHH